MSVLTEKWHTQYLGGGDSESRLRFSKFCHQNPFLCKFEPKKLAHSISRMLILILILFFWVSKPKSVFQQIGAEKVSLSCAWKFARRVS